MWLLAGGEGGDRGGSLRSTGVMGAGGTLGDLRCDGETGVTHGRVSQGQWGWQDSGGSEVSLRAS